MIDSHVPKFVLLNRDTQKHFIETLVFSSEGRLTIKSLVDILSEKDAFFEKYQETKEHPLDKIDTTPDGTPLTEESFEEVMGTKFALNQKYVKALIDEINIDLETTNRPFRIVDFAGGYQYATLNEYGELVASVVKARSKKRLTKSQLETLAIIAYKQPVTKPEVEKIRGVNSKETLNSMVEKGFLTVLGRSDAIGKPLLYGTTELFLETFGLNSLKDLPNLREIEEIMSDAPSEEELEGVKIKVNPTTLEREERNESKKSVKEEGDSAEEMEKEEDNELKASYVTNK